MFSLFCCCASTYVFTLIHGALAGRDDHTSRSYGCKLNPGQALTVGRPLEMAVHSMFP